MTITTTSTLSTSVGVNAKQNSIGSLESSNKDVSKLLKTIEKMGFQFKLVVFAPENAADQVRKVMGLNGAGIIRDYAHCSVSSSVTARYRLMTTPGVVGSYSAVEKISEERIEMVVSSVSLLFKVLEAIRKVHPYHTIGFDVYPLVPAINLTPRSKL